VPIDTIRRGRSILALPIALVAAVCGGAPHRTAAPPPIRAADAAPPPLVLQDLRQNLDLASTGAATTSMHTTFSCDAGGGKTRPCTKAEIARIGAVTRLYDRATTPTRMSAVRVVAVLRLPYGYRELLLAWPTRSGRQCLSVAQDPGGGASSPFGPCLRVLPGANLGSFGLGDALEPCGAICLSSWTVEVGLPSKYVLAGTVAPRATALRVTVGGGAVTTYPLRGPLLHGAHERIFMAVVGLRSWRRLELLRGTSVVATQVMSAREAAFQDCTELLDNDFTKLKECDAKARSLPGP
jgi:hypothetical protein